MKRFKKIVSWAVLICLVCVLTGTVYANTNIQDQIGVKWWTMNQAHDGAEICRRLGGDNSAALAYFGERWTTANNERKELEAQATPTPTQRLEYLGNYQLTAYEYGTGPNSYNGKSQTLNHTVASDSIPGGTWIYIEGYGEYYVEDSGVGNPYTIDIFLGDPGACRQFGRKYNVPVYKIIK